MRFSNAKKSRHALELIDGLSASQKANYPHEVEDGGSIIISEDVRIL